MSQQTNSSISSVSSSVHDQLNSQTRSFNCRWSWCRFSTSSNAGLVEHVVEEHIQNATPVRKRDISLLRRAEEGIGESLSLSLKRMIGGSHDTIGSRLVHSANVTGQDNLTSPRPLSSTHPYTSPLPSPPERSSSVSSTSHRSSRNHAKAERARTASPLSSYELEQGPSMSPPAYSRIRDSHSPSPSLPATPRFPFTSFVAYSSPLAPYSVPSVPASPLHSGMANASRGADSVDLQRSSSSFDPTDSPAKRRKINVTDKPAERLPYRLSHTSNSQSQSSTDSCDLVERQLTQSLDMDVDVQGAAISDGDGQRNDGSKESVVGSYPSGKGQVAEAEIYSAELPSGSQSQSKSEPESQPQPQPQPRPQPAVQTRLAGPIASPAQRKVQRQAWYQLSPYNPLRTRTHPQSDILNTPGTSTPTSQTRTPLHSNLPRDARSHSKSLLQSGSDEPLIRSQSQGQLSASGPLFRSGSLRVRPKGSKAAPTTNVSSQLVTTGKEGETHGKENGDDAMHIYEDQSPSLIQAGKRSNSRAERFDLPPQLSYQSQSLSSTDGSPTTGIDSDSLARPFSYGFLTQAPYQSQSLSQSQS